ncbi:chloride channel protein [Limibacillus sp. MBR-115]|uniref:chloride channel protein n=1 Tax=Limibacillus sp. MBR-115 TaxID=3156465 RepID=UPI003396DBFE
MDEPEDAGMISIADFDLGRRLRRQRRILALRWYRTRRALQSPHLKLFLLSILVGLAGGLAGIGFRLGIDFFQWLALSVRGENLLAAIDAVPWWRILLSPMLGGLIIGLFVYHFMPGRQQPQAVSQVIEASAFRGGRMSSIVGLKAAVVNALSIGCGGSVGREGPVVHLGASIGSFFANRLHLGRAMSRTLLGCGVAAAVAASFNAPIAGVFFALEVVVGHYALSAFAPVVVASVLGTMVSRMYFGDFPAFVLPATREITSFFEFPAFALLGIISAIAAILFMRSIMAVEDTWLRFPKVPSWARPAIGGLAVGCIALVFPQVLGVGYGATDAALSETLPLWLLFALILMKTLATALSLGSGFGGGIFSPSLFLGAMVGGAFGVLATSVFPDLSSGHGAYTIVGMGAVSGAVLGAPISTVLIIFEMTNDYALTIAVMIATAIASIITQQLFGKSFFQWQLERRGISLAGGREVGLLRALEVSGFTDKAVESVDPGTPLAEVRRKLAAAPWSLLAVVDDDERLVGLISFPDLAELAFDSSSDEIMVAQDTMHKAGYLLTARDDLQTAVQAFGASGEVHLPVVFDREEQRFLGFVHEHEVMVAYHRTLQQARREERGEV